VRIRDELERVDRSVQTDVVLMVGAASVASGSDFQAVNVTIPRKGDEGHAV
jgi:hypothetical protein